LGMRVVPSSRGMVDRSAVLRAIALGVSLALCTFFTFATLGLVLLFVIFWIFQLLEERDRGLRTLAILMIAAFTLVACFGLVYATSGCDIIACARASIAYDAEKMRPQREHYWDTSFTNLLGFLVGSGLAASTLWLRDASSGLKPPRRESG